eukprot:1653663-Prymnesium_polylepis.2
MRTPVNQLQVRKLLWFESQRGTFGVQDRNRSDEWRGPAREQLVARIPEQSEEEGRDKHRPNGDEDICDVPDLTVLAG